MVQSLQDFLNERHGFAAGSRRGSSRIDSRAAFTGTDPIMTPGNTGRVAWIDRETNSNEQEFLASLEETGKVISFEQFQERDKRYSQLEMMDVATAEKLERVGLKGYSDCDPVSYVGLHTGVIKEKPNCAHNNLIPSRAAEKRKDLLNALIYFIEEESKNPKLRFYNFCVHDGPRCLATDLVARWKIQAKNFRLWNKSDYAKRLGAFFVFRSHEAGSPVKKEHEKVWNEKKGVHERPYVLDKNGKRVPCLDKEGRQTWHPHSHAILMRTRYLKEEERAELMRRLQSHFNCVYPLQGEIANVRETCKYVVKSDELLNCSDEAFFDYCVEVKGKRSVEAMNTFRDFRKWLKDSTQKIRPVYNAQTGKAEYKLSRNWNRNVAKDVCDKDGAQHWADIVNGPSGPLSTPAIIARCAPQAMNCPVTEPFIMVRGRGVDFAELAERKEVANVIALTRDDFAAGAAEFERVNGVSLSKWLEDPFLAMLGAQNQTDFAVENPELWGSAHNTPANGRFESSQPYASKHPKDFEAKNERSEVPNGRRDAVFSNKQSQKSSLEPHAAVNRHFPTQKDGSFANVEEEEVLTNYF